MRYSIKHLPTEEKDTHMCYVYPKLTVSGWEPSMGPRIGFWNTLHEANQFISNQWPTATGEYMVEEVKNVRPKKTS